MSNQQGQPQWPPPSGQPPNWYLPNQGWGSPQQPSQQRQPQPNTPYPQQSYQPPPQYYQQQPYYQQPPMPPPKKKSRTWLWIVLGVACVLVCSCIGFSALAASQQKTPTSSNTNSSTQSATQAITPSQVLPTAKPTPAQTSFTATHGTPHIGGPISDFYGKYGKPNNQGNGNSQTWIADSQQPILVNASPNAQGEVTAMNVVGSSSWSHQQTESYCGQFLPRDASEFNHVKDSVNTLIDYHSSVGEVVMTVVDQGSCLLNITQQ